MCFLTFLFPSSFIRQICLLHSILLSFLVIFTLSIPPFLLSFIQFSFQSSAVSCYAGVRCVGGIVAAAASDADVSSGDDGNCTSDSSGDLAPKLALDCGIKFEFGACVALSE